jgi:hypothetical protein
MYPISQTTFIGHLNNTFFIAKRSYILESGFFLTFSAVSHYSGKPLHEAAYGRSAETKQDQPRQGRVRIARQELPGSLERSQIVPSGTAEFVIAVIVQK